MLKKRHLLNCNIAGFSYWDGAEAFNQLTIGSELQLKAEPDNRFDQYAVAIYFGEYKLGYLPREVNKDISKYLEMGYGDIYEVRINQISPDKHPEQQIGIIVKIKAKK